MIGVLLKVREKGTVRKFSVIGTLFIITVYTVQIRLIKINKVNETKLLRQQMFVVSGKVQSSTPTYSSDP